MKKKAFWTRLSTVSFHEYLAGFRPASIRPQTADIAYIEYMVIMAHLTH